MSNTTTSQVPPHQPPDKRANTIGWVLATGLAGACVITGVALQRVLAIFSSLFEGIGLRLPVLTRFLLSYHALGATSVFVGLAATVIVRQFVMKDELRRFIEIAIGFAAAFGLMGVVVAGMYLPLFQLIWKLEAGK